MPRGGNEGTAGLGLGLYSIYKNYLTTNRIMMFGCSLRVLSVVEFQSGCLDNFARVVSINATDLRLPGCQPSHSSAPGLLHSYASRRGGRISRDLSVTPLGWHLRVGCVSSPRRTCTPARRQASGIKWKWMDRPPLVFTQPHLTLTLRSPALLREEM